MTNWKFRWPDEFAWERATALCAYRVLRACTLREFTVARVWREGSQPFRRIRRVIFGWVILAHAPAKPPAPPPFALLRASNYHCKSHTLLQLMSISQPSRPLTLNFTNLFSLYSLRILRRLLFVWLSYLFIDINCYLFTLINIFYIFFYYWLNIFFCSAKISPILIYLLAGLLLMTVALYSDVEGMGAAWAWDSRSDLPRSDEDIVMSKRRRVLDTR